MRSLTFLSKLTMFGFLLATVPVIFIGAFAYVTSSNEIQKNVNAGKMQLIMQINSNVEQKLTTVNHTLNQVINSSVLKKALNRPLTVDDFMIYDELRGEIRHMQSFDTRLEDVVLINGRHNWMIKNSGLYAFDEYAHYDELAGLLQTPEGTSWTLNPSDWFYSEEAAGSASCGYSVSLVKKLPTAGLEKYGLALANIPACSLQELLEEDGAADSSFMILDDHYRILLHPDHSLIGSPVSEAGLRAERLTGSSGQFTAPIGQEDYSLTYYRSELNGWIYLSATSIAGMTKESNKIGSYTLYVCLLMLAVSMLLAWMGSRRMYSPIRLLLNQIGERLTDIRKRRTNEFQAIGERVTHLFQSKTELEKELRQHLPQVRAFFFMKALQGHVRPSEVADKLRQFGYGAQLQEWKTMAAVTLQIDFSEDSRYSKDDRELLLFAIHNIVEELVPAGERLAPVVMDQTIVAIVGSAETDHAAFHDWALALSEHAQRQIDGCLSVRVSIGISLPFGSFGAMAIACREGLEALKHRIKLGEAVIIPYANVNAGKHYLNVNYPAHLENELMDAIKLADKEKAKELLRAFLQAVLEAELSPREYQIPLARLLGNLLVAMQESGISPSQLHPMKGSMLEELLALHTAAEIGDWFWTRAVRPMADIFKDRQEAQYHNLSEQIIDLVQRHYDTDLTLEECAARLHYNANYLSSVFRKETSYSFTEYLTMYRFRMAKKWLEGSEMPIKDIAAKLCYNNPQNFIRSFRKQEGMTPGQYRERKRIG
ncbi:AraC family transcriptional regulator [Paenibacillus arenilitoris]|uniref:AraC family transcriptional regulator n=1 Tax=Paenibacillus arenilitoris TaxID=2772299 RepID=A0A927CKD9_9BACL|nr:AraC family transcriptional regulator [Paenibacillus arenilitoris]MBD2868193.1 AraC family transcriptional regulator [Paenibacillus arenilitoris]